MWMSTPAVLEHQKQYCCTLHKECSVQQCCVFSLKRCGKVVSALCLQLQCFKKFISKWLSELDSISDVLPVNILINTVCFIKQTWVLWRKKTVLFKTPPFPWCPPGLSSWTITVHHLHSLSWTQNSPMWPQFSLQCWWCTTLHSHQAFGCCHHTIRQTA